MGLTLPKQNVKHKKYFSVNHFNTYTIMLVHFKKMSLTTNRTFCYKWSQSIPKQLHFKHKRMFHLKHINKTQSNWMCSTELKTEPV